MCIHAGNESGKLGMLVDGGFDGCLVHGKVQIAGAFLFKQGLPKLRTDIPVTLECINISTGNAAMQMAFDILQVLSLLAVDVAWEVEVELVLLDFLQADHPRVFRDLSLPGENVHYLVDILGTEAVLGTILHETRTGIDHKNALAVLSFLLVDNNNTCRDAGAVEKVGWQAYDSLNVALAHERTADIGLGIATEQHTVRQDACTFARALERTNNMQQISIISLLGRRNSKGLETLVSIFKWVQASAPALVTERGIGDDVIKGLERFTVLELGICQSVTLHDKRLRVVVQDHVHAGKTGCGCVFFLTVQGYLGPCLVCDLQKQRTGTACRIIGRGGACGIGLADSEYLCYDPADLGRGIELTFAFAALRCEVAHQVFVSIAQDIVTFGTVLREIKGRILENSNEVGKPVHLFLTAAELGQRR